MLCHCSLSDADTQSRTQRPAKKTCVTFKTDDLIVDDTSDNDIDAEDELESMCLFFYY